MVDQSAGNTVRPIEIKEILSKPRPVSGYGSISKQSLESLKITGPSPMSSASAFRKLDEAVVNRHSSLEIKPTRIIAK